MILLEKVVKLHSKTQEYFDEKKKMQKKRMQNDITSKN